jgi:tetratricopeptide (TPR) repeat protein
MDGMMRPGTWTGPFDPRARLRSLLARPLAASLVLVALAGPAHAAARPAAPAASPAEADRAAPPPALRDVADWIRWKHARQISSLPAESRIFYRRGLLAMQSGQRAEALAAVRGAVELDPTFVQPHLTLAGWLAFADPPQALVHAAAVVERLRRDFNLQVDLVANALTLGLDALFAGLLFAGVILVFLRRHDLSHGFEEPLAQQVSRRSAQWWVPVLLVTPFLAGLGLTLPVLLMLGFLWPILRPRERGLFVVLLAASLASPFAPGALGRYALALRTDAAPFHGLPSLEHVVWTAERQDRLERAVAADPDNGFVQFALAWHSRRGGDLARAERAYEAALRAWPEHAAVLTDLGNVAAMRGQSDRALQLYQRAAARDPRNAAAHFNAAQLLTRRFEYAAANEELRQASAIDFDLVRQYQSRAGESGLLPLVDVWPDPATFWTGLNRSRARGPLPLPLPLRGHIESTGWGFGLAAAAAAGLGLWLGRWRHRRLPLRHCTNCEVVVCRRCARRRREAALCEECDRISAGAETPEFSRVLLLQHRARRRDGRRVLRTALAAVLPGFGLLAHQRVVLPVVLLSLTWLLGRLALGLPLPFSVTARLALPGSGVPAVALWTGFVLVYAVSLFSYLVVTARERQREAQLEQASSRSRLTQATHRQPTLAA